MALNRGDAETVNDDEQTSTVPADYTTRVSPFVERFAADMTEAGMQRMASRVFACLLASRPGAQAVRAAHPDVPIWTAAMDEELNDHGYIVPGLGDAGDRTYGTR